MRTVSEEQVRQRLRVENPWWQTNRIPAGLMDFRPRAYLDLFKPLVEELEVRRAVVLMGPRRVGKTVLLHHTIQELLEAGAPGRSVMYVSVDHPIYTGLGLTRLLELCRAESGVGAEEQVYAIFDEIQYLREWERHLKSLVDTESRVKAVVSGSAAAALRLSSRESGAGRFTDFFLPPLTFFEFLDLLGLADLVDTAEEELGFYVAKDISELNRQFGDYLNYGGYPEVVLSELVRSDMARFIKSDIVDKVLLRDLPSLYGIGDIQELNYLFTTLAFNTAGEVSLDELAKNSGVSKNTIKKYIEYLEAAFLIRVVHRVDRAGKRFKRQNFFKVYLANPSMRAALFAPVGEGDAALGSLTETAAFAQWFHAHHVSLHYARWQSGEVDLVSLSGAQTVSWAAEIKWSDRYATSPHELRNLISFAKKHGLEDVTCTTKTVTTSTSIDGVPIEFVPASLYCFTVGHNLIRAKKMFPDLAHGVQ